MSKSTIPYGYERLESLPSPTPRAAVPRHAASGRPSPSPLTSPPQTPLSPMASIPHLSAQHERLILELLPFKEPAKFHEWLQGPFVRGPWLEFCRDFLSKSAGPASLPEPDKAKTAQAARDAINSRSQKFLVYFPEKQGWTVEDHHVRFIVVIICDNMLRNMWSESEFKKKGLDIAKSMYEVLSFLRASQYLADGSPPGYSA